MPERPSDPNTPHAPYMRVLNALMDQIGTGEGKRFPPGAKLPSEAELCAEFKVARMTARRAVRVLRERGLVATEWGKGTFVVGSPVPESEHQGDA
ncbi:winged helix-turn-helix domain-containing protein [Streptomyces spectabilis]|uniref:GntR family transcriptional regulator n=1 Tax=Streptomyces spectabilis TaxID=68270 RepID=UPI0034039162